MGQFRRSGNERGFLSILLRKNHLHSWAKDRYMQTGVSYDAGTMSVAFFQTFNSMLLHHTWCSNLNKHGCMILLQSTLIGKDQACTRGKKGCEDRTWTGTENSRVNHGEGGTTGTWTLKRTGAEAETKTTTVSLPVKQCVVGFNSTTLRIF